MVLPKTFTFFKYVAENINIVYFYFYGNGSENNLVNSNIGGNLRSENSYNDIQKILEFQSRHFLKAFLGILTENSIF